MNKILVTTDFSDNANNALVYAIHFAKERNVSIDLVHFVVPIVEISDSPISSGQATLRKVEIAKELIKEQAHNAKKQVSEEDHDDDWVSVRTFVKVDNPSHGIRTMAQEGNYSLLIMGSRGENVKALEKLIGTVSANIISNAPCPVLLIPSDEKYEHFERVGYATNLSDSDPFEIWRALKLVKPDVPILNLFHILDKDSEKEHKRKEELSEYLYDHNDALKLVFYDVMSNEVEKSLAEVSENYDLDLLIATRTKQSFLDRLLYKSHTQSLMRKVDVPLMVLNQHV